jgi:ParB-like chromosome segregation protein Spo0J
MDDQTAMQRAFKENVEREPLSPIDEAAWFFEMLGLKEEQLYTEKAASAALALPTSKNPHVNDLADALGTISPNLIENRLPLLALPENMQKQVGHEDGIIVECEKKKSATRKEGFAELKARL